MQEKIGFKIDVSNAETELQQAIANVRRENIRITALENDIDLLDPLADDYSAKRERLNERLSSLQERVMLAEQVKQEKLTILQNIKSQVVTIERIYEQ